MQLQLALGGKMHPKHESYTDVLPWDVLDVGFQPCNIQFEYCGTSEMYFHLKILCETSHLKRGLRPIEDKLQHVFL